MFMQKLTHCGRCGVDNKVRQKPKTLQRRRCLKPKAQPLKHPSVIPNFPQCWRHLHTFWQLLRQRVKNNIYGKQISIYRQQTAPRRQRECGFSVFGGVCLRIWLKLPYKIIRQSGVKEGSSGATTMQPTECQRKFWSLCRLSASINGSISLARRQPKSILRLSTVHSEKSQLP